MITGNKIGIESVERDNLDQIRKWRNDPNNRRHFRAFKDISTDMQEAWYKSIGNNSDPNHVYFQVIELEEAKLVGICGLNYINWQLKSAEASVMIGNEYAGRGFGTEAIRTMCSYGFDEMNMHKIWCEIFDNNPASLHMFEKVGFVLEGKIRHNYFHEGKYGDSYRLSLFSNELVR